MSTTTMDTNVSHVVPQVFDETAESFVFDVCVLVRLSGQEVISGQPGQFKSTRILFIRKVRHT